MELEKENKLEIRKINLDLSDNFKMNGEFHLKIKQLGEKILTSCTIRDFDGWQGCTTYIENSRSAFIVYRLMLYLEKQIIENNTNKINEVITKANSQ